MYMCEVFLTSCVSAVHLPSWHMSIKWSCTYVYVPPHTNTYAHTCQCMSTIAESMKDGPDHGWLTAPVTWEPEEEGRTSHLYDTGAQQLYSMANMVPSTCQQSRWIKRYKVWIGESLFNFRISMGSEEGKRNYSKIKIIFNMYQNFLTVAIRNIAF